MIDVSPRHDLARAALAGFGLPADARLDFVTLRENQVFRVTTAELDLALKLHRPGYRDDAALAAESALLERFDAAGIRVPRPLHARDGGYLVRVPRPEGGVQQVSAQHWLPAANPIGDSGAAYLGELRPSAAHLAALGAVAARLHDVIEAQGAPAEFRRGAWDAEGLVGESALWGRASGFAALPAEAREAFAAAERRLAAELGALARDPRHYGPIHADLTMENVLEDAAGLVVIDFDDSGEGWYLFDLATACFFLTGHPDAPELVAEVLADYQAERPFDEQDRRAWHPLLLARALSYFGWSAERPETEATAFHLEVLLPAVVAAARRYAETGDTGWPGPTTAGVETDGDADRPDPATGHDPGGAAAQTEGTA